MLASEQVESLICLLASWDRPTLISQLLAFHSNFPIDFTPDFLSKRSVEELRHLFLAVCLQNRTLPELAAAA
jgi:hypothetical protein